MLWKFFGSFLAVIGLFVMSASAADEFCGVDTDFNGTIDNPCGPVDDPDRDGDWYVRSADFTGPTLGIDCNDDNWWDRPGVETRDGCPVDEFRTCQPDGTYDACSPIANFTCHTGSGKTVWFGPSGVTTAGCGTARATPCNWLCTSNPALGCYDALDAGDCSLLMTGAHSGSWVDGADTRQFFVDDRDGTVLNPIVMRGEPGAIPGYASAAVINGAGTSPTTEAFAIYSVNSDNVQFKLLEFDGTGDYSNTGIHYDGGANPLAELNYIHHMDGESNNNLSGVKCRVDTANCTVRNNIFEANCEVGSCTDQNSGDVTVMDDTGDVVITGNVAFGGTRGFCFRIKHADDLVTVDMSRNFCKGVNQYGIGSENKDNIVENNWITDCTAYALYYGGIGGTGGWWKDSIFSKNTVERCALLRVAATWTNSLGHQNYSGTTVFTADHNIMDDDNASYDGDEGDGVLRFCEYDCEAGEFAAAAGKTIWSNNVYWSSGTSSLRFGYFGQEGGGADYAGFAAWQAADPYSGAPLVNFDTGSEQDDPGLDSDGLSAEYPDHGWRAGAFTGDAGPASVVLGGRGALRISRGRLQ